MATKTENYQLNQWEPEDNFLRTDFNEDNAKIEAALTTLTTGQIKLVTGSYTGSGTGSTKTITLGFHPKAVALDNSKGYRTTHSGGIIFDGAPLVGNCACVTSSGFTVTGECNSPNYTYHYIAFG